MNQAAEQRTYLRKDSIVFRKTNERFGGLSNMSPGFPLEVNGVPILTSEALYQACRFPQRPEIQRLVIQQASPMTAKMKSKPYRRDTRPDWDSVRVRIMRWCLRVKLAQNWESFSTLLLSTGYRPIVEESRKDDYWAAKPGNDDTLVGTNALGRLLMELREALRAPDSGSLRSVAPIPIPRFLLFEKEIGVVVARIEGGAGPKPLREPVLVDSKLPGEGDHSILQQATENRIHPFFNEKREWSRVKDKILRDYITCYLRTVHRRGRPIIIVDAFAGPGRFGDGSDGSPLIVCGAIENAPKREIGIACVFSDSHPPHRAALQQNLVRHIASGIATTPLSDFSEALSRALHVGRGATLFFYLDPYGIKDLDFDTVRQIYERDVQQSTEVLINFSFRTFMRMSGNWSYTDSASAVAKKVKRAKVAAVNAVMGGDYWIGIVTDPQLDKIQREDLVVAAYMARIRKFFDYTYAIPVKQLDDSRRSVPVDDLAKYHLIFGTRSAKAVVYMNDVAINALEPYFRQFREGLLFDMIPGRYEPCPYEELKAAIVEAVRAGPMTRPQIYETVIPRYFMQRRQKDYRAAVDELTFKEQKLYPDHRTMKRSTQLNNETLLSATPTPGGEG